MHVMYIVHYNTAQCTDNDEDDGDSARITHYLLYYYVRPQSIFAHFARHYYTLFYTQTERKRSSEFPSR